LCQTDTLGFHPVPLLSNTTHVMQETDHLYGPFKTRLLANLDLICDAQLKENVSLSPQPKVVGLPLFGGVDTENGCNIEVSAFDQAFGKKKCVQEFKRVGAVTKDGITCARLKDMQVMQSIGDGNKETVLLHHAVQTQTIMLFIA
jgi:hypothetical protein